MNKTIYISLLLFSMAAFVSVSCEAMKVPVATMTYEKSLTPSVEGNSDGAITIQLASCEAMYESIESLAPRNYLVDETFYEVGYKAKLSSHVIRIIAPPENRKKIYLDQIKQC